jgi:hypothetical protein
MWPWVSGLVLASIATSAAACAAGTYGCQCNKSSSDVDNNLFLSISIIGDFLLFVVIGAAWWSNSCALGQTHYQTMTGRPARLFYAGLYAAGTFLVVVAHVNILSDADTDPNEWLRGSSYKYVLWYAPPAVATLVMIFSAASSVGYDWWVIYAAHFGLAIPLLVLVSGNLWTTDILLPLVVAGVPMLLLNRKDGFVQLCSPEFKSRYDGSSAYEPTPSESDGPRPRNCCGRIGYTWRLGLLWLIDLVALAVLFSVFQRKWPCAHDRLP